MSMRIVGVLKPRTKKEMYALLAMNLKIEHPYRMSQEDVSRLQKDMSIGHLVCDLTASPLTVSVMHAIPT